MSMPPLRHRLRAVLLSAGTALSLSLATAGPAGAQGTASAPDHPFDSTWLAAELARLGGEITAVVPPAFPHPKDPVILNSGLAHRQEPTVDSTQVIVGGNIEVTRRKRERADPAAQSFYYGQAGTYLHGTKRWMGHAFYATCGRLDAARGKFGIRVKLGHKGSAGQRTQSDQWFVGTPQASPAFYTRAQVQAAVRSVRKRVSRRHPANDVFSM